jgi:hypothetical protein
LGDQEALGKGSTDVALVAKEASEEATDQAGNWSPIVGVAGSEAQREQLAAVVDDQMELEAVEPPDRRLAAPGIDPKDAVLRDAGRMADGERGGVDEADPRTLPQLRVQLDGQRHEVAGHEGHEAGITQQGGKLLAQVNLNMLRVEPFERPIPRLLEEDEDGEDLGGMQPCCAAALACPAPQQLTLPPRLEPLPKGIYRAKEIEYTHRDTSSRADGLW